MFKWYFLLRRVVPNVHSCLQLLFSGVWSVVCRDTIMAHYSSSMARKFLVLLTASIAIAVDGMTVTMENDMAQAISISCRSTKADLGTKVVATGLSYDIADIGSFTAGLRYTCSFVAPGKATTTFDVFVGWGGVKNLPCNCLGDTCKWLVLDTGFSCNGGAYTRTWG